MCNLHRRGRDDGYGDMDLATSSLNSVGVMGWVVAGIIPSFTMFLAAAYSWLEELAVGGNRTTTLSSRWPSLLLESALAAIVAVLVSLAAAAGAAADTPEAAVDATASFWTLVGFLASLPLLAGVTWRRRLLIRDPANPDDLLPITGVRDNEVLQNEIKSRLATHDVWCSIVMLIATTILLGLMYDRLTI